MSKILVLAEKPSVGRDIGKVLKCHKKTPGYLEGDSYIVTWGLGHLVTLATPDQYDKKYNEWRLEDLPMLPDDLKTIVIGKTSRQFNTVKTQLNRKDVKEIVIATDAGREGELVARWILEKARVNKPVKRLWISSVTDKAIRDGFKKLRPGKAYENLYASAVARSEADWYVGLNATRALTTKFNAQLSSGRVQTPTLGILKSREDQIKHFVAQTYYSLEADLGNGLIFNYAGKDTRFFSKEKADQLVSSLEGQSLSIKTVEEKNKKTFAPQLYDLTELQQEANRLFAFSGKQTLNLMQNLYERHKVLTYPRTDSRVITTDIIPTLKDRIQAISVGEYGAMTNLIDLNALKNLPRSVVNDQAVSDHHAIIPTEEPVFLNEMNPQERKIYDLVIKRFIAVLSPAHAYKETMVTAEALGHPFIYKENEVITQGWKAVYTSKEKVAELRRFTEGKEIPNVRFKLVQGKTSAPPRLTEGTLLKAMENPIKYMADSNAKLARTMKEAGGLGTVATRADIIDKLYNTGYMEKKGRGLHLTKKGEQILELAPEALRSPTLTAEWEMKLQKIEGGELSKSQFIKEIKEYTARLVREIKQSEASYKHDNITGTHCPKCSSFMLEIENRQGKMLRCENRACNHKRNVYKNTNARCPDCKKKLRLFGEGDGQIFTCSCGHREKLSSFEKRRKKSKQARASKQDVQKYIKKQDDEQANNPFADALKDLLDK